MQLSDLSSGPPASKTWLNINCGALNTITLQANTLEAKNLASVIQIQAGIVLDSGGGTITLSANQIVSGVFGFTNTTTVNLPTATDINNYIGTFPADLEIPLYYFVFKVYVSQGTITFNPGTGTSTYDNNSTFTYSGRTSHDITYALTLLGWQIFY